MKLELLTFNIRYGTAPDGENAWSHREGRLKRFLQRRGMDILCLQEALDFQVEELETALPDYASVGRAREDGRTAGEHAPIFYDRRRYRLLASDTYWLSDTPHVPGSVSWGNRLTRISTWAHFQNRSTRQSFYIYNVHLDHESQPSRVRSVQALKEFTGARATADPVAIAGDFNVGEGNPVRSAMIESGFRDAYRQIHPGRKPLATFNGFSNEYPAEKIDYIFADSAWHIDDCDILMDKPDGKWMSDHMPLFAQLSLPILPG